ncbi:MAG: hypothetical protein ACLFUP_06620 [Desulfobacteraceae bacterium]
MTDDKESGYTCRSYREEMVLLGLKKRLENPELSDEERRSLCMELERMEREMGMD